MPCHRRLTCCSACPAMHQVAGGLNEIGSVFSSAAARAPESIGSDRRGIGSGAVDAVSSGVADSDGEVASSAGDGIVDLVTDGIGSPLGSLFD